VNGRLLPRAEAVGLGLRLGLHARRRRLGGPAPLQRPLGLPRRALDRLFEAAKAIDLDIGRDRPAWSRRWRRPRLANGMQTDAHARLMVTRGTKVRPFQHPSLSRTGPTMVIIMEHSRPSIPRPIRLATVPHLRGLPMSQDPKLNSHSKLNCILACIAAEKAGADEALMLDVHGFVNTTNACNFFIVRRGEVWTSTGDYCMNGITRAKVIELCRAERHPRLRAQLLAGRDLFRRRSLPDRHLR
jgi:branched-chain amino acid aminotransferase